MERARPAARDGRVSQKHQPGAPQATVADADAYGNDLVKLPAKVVVRGHSVVVSQAADPLRGDDGNGGYTRRQCEVRTHVLSQPHPHPGMHGYLPTHPAFDVPRAQPSASRPSPARSALPSPWSNPPPPVGSGLGEEEEPEVVLAREYDPAVNELEGAAVPAEAFVLDEYSDDEGDGGGDE